jgi:predicted DNA-binding protein with PD1-like motif
MESSEEKGLLIARLDDGEDVFASIDELSRKHDLRSALIISGIGMLEGVTLGFFDGDGYSEKNLEGSFELVAMHGSIADGTIHIHVSLGDERCETKSGHLLSARVKIQNELLIQRLDEVKLSRIPKGGVNVLGFEV